MNTEKTVKVIGYTFNPATRMVDLPIEYVARNRQEAINWMNFMQNWARGLKIIEA